MFCYLDFDKDLRCDNFNKKNYQQIVFVNKKDVETFKINNPAFNKEDYSVNFMLRANKEGSRLSSLESGASIYGKTQKSIRSGINEYKHTIHLIIPNATIEDKLLLSSLDNGDYFCALQNYNGDIEIYGFEYGLKPDNYELDLINNFGIVEINLSSKSESLENYLPLIFKSGGNENTLFNNKFKI